MFSCTVNRWLKLHACVCVCVKLHCQQLSQEAVIQDLTSSGEIGSSNKCVQLHRWKKHDFHDRFDPFEKGR